MKIVRVNVLGEKAEHIIDYPDSGRVIRWLQADPATRPYVQDEFPDMKVEDREFLLTGLTPARYDELFPEDESKED